MLSDNTYTAVNLDWKTLNKFYLEEIMWKEEIAHKGAKKTLNLSVTVDTANFASRRKGYSSEAFERVKNSDWQAIGRMQILDDVIRLYPECQREKIELISALVLEHMMENETLLSDINKWARMNGVERDEAAAAMSYLTGLNLVDESGKLNKPGIAKVIFKEHLMVTRRATKIMTYSELVKSRDDK